MGPPLHAVPLLPPSHARRADMSVAGLQRSCGLMVNYRYVLAEAEANSRAYLSDHVIAASEAVTALLRQQ